MEALLQGGGDAVVHRPARAAAGVAGVERHRHSRRTRQALLREYKNYGPGAGVAGRVPWPGHRVINSTAEAERFTVARFIDGASWLPATGVSFVAGLSLL